MIQKNEKVSHTVGLEGLILLKWPYYTKRSIDLVWSLSNYQDFFHRSRQIILKLISSVQSFSRVGLFATPWTATCQAFLSIINSHSLLKLMSIGLVMPSNHLILCHPLLLLPSIFPSIRVFFNESVLCIRRTKFGVSASTSVLPMNLQDWFLLGWTCWISLLSKGLSRVISNTTVQKHQFFSTQLSL